MIPAKLDEFGRELEKPIVTWFPRGGVALALAQLAPLITPDLIGGLVQFFVSTSLSDRNEQVRKEMLNAALKIVDLHGKVCTYSHILLPSMLLSSFVMTRSGLPYEAGEAMGHQ